MAWGKKLAVTVLSLLMLFFFVQGVGGYLIEQLSQSSDHLLESQAEEKILKQMVLQLEPVEYYTFQLGTYQDAAAGQASINRLAQMGYRVCVSDGPPYEIWLGCLGKMPDAHDLPEEILADHSDVFVRKKILNETAFKFSESDGQGMERIATLLSSYDVVLKHSLQMFQDYRYDACSEQNWSDMTKQICGELEMLRETANLLLTEETSDTLARGVLNLLAITEEYEESLQFMQEKKTDRVVLLAQSCLLDLIAQYHSFMVDESNNKINL